MSRETVVVTFMNGPADGRWVIVHGPSVGIGRGADNDVVIDFDPSVADQHLELLYREGQWLLVDRSEGSGVFVGGVRIHEQTPLVPDKLVSMGDTLLRIGVAGTAR